VLRGLTSAGCSVCLLTHLLTSATMGRVDLLIGRADYCGC
jgi:hypothetical protein